MPPLVTLTPAQIQAFTDLVFTLIEQNKSLANSIPVLQQQQSDFQAIDDDFKDIHETIEGQSGAIVDFERERKFLTGPFVSAAEVVTETKIQDSVTDPYIDGTSILTHPLFPDPGSSPPADPIPEPRKADGLFGGTGTEPTNESAEKTTEFTQIGILLGMP